jgi:hypothetical protein
MTMRLAPFQFSLRLAENSRVAEGKSEPGAAMLHDLWASVNIHPRSRSAGGAQGKMFCEMT